MMACAIMGGSAKTGRWFASTLTKTSFSGGALIGGLGLGTLDPISHHYSLSWTATST